jgi:acyl carrier protein
VATDLADDLARGIEEPVRFDPAVRALIAAGHRTFVELGPGTTATRIVEGAGGIAVPLDPSDGGVVAAAAALLSLGHPGLARLLPGTLVEHALPAPPSPPPRLATTPAAPRSTAPVQGLTQRANQVQDLRIAALADPALAPVYERARAELLRALAEADAGGAPVGVPSPPPEPVPARVLAPAPTPEPAPPPPVEPAPADDVRAVVVATICDATGYPPDLITDGADLEGDLGVDSIRKMEILGALEKRFGFTTAEADYARLADADLAALVAHVRRHLGAAPPPVAEVAPEPASTVSFAVERPRRLPTGPRVRAVAEVVQVPEGKEPAEALEALVRRPLPAPILAVAPVDAGGAAAVGWLRSAARELGRELVVVRPTLPVSRERVQAELASGGSTERWLDEHGAFACGPLEVDPQPGRPWPDRPVILATGGTRGVVVPCLVALADLRPRVVLLARTPEERVLNELDRLRSAGIEVLYAEGDVTRPDDVFAAAKRARAEWGRIDVVVHGAGVLRDGPLQAQTDEDRRQVLAVKWDGANHLVAATRDDALTAFVTFSSVVAHLGNPAQTAYGAANAALEAVSHPTARTVSLAWTAWSEVGMAADPRLQALFASRGVRSLTPRDGAEAFRRVVRSDLHGTVLVTNGPLPDLRVARWPLAAPTEIGPRRVVVPVPLDPRSPALADHRVGGRPLVPAATWLAALLEAASLASGWEGCLVVDGLAILAPTFVDRPRTDVRIELVEEELGWTAVIRAGETAVCRATVSVCTDAPETPRPPTPFEDSEPAGPLYRPDLLFHGPTWQVLRRIRWSSGSDAAAELEPGAPSALASAVDGVHQLLAAWSGRSVGWLGLPVGADRWVAPGPHARPAVGPVRIETEARADGREMSARVVARDAHGRLLLRGEGVRLRAAGRGVGDA